MDEGHDWLALTLVPGVGARTFHRLIQRFGSPKRVLGASRQQLERVQGLKSSSIDAIRSLPLEEAVKKEMARVNGLGIRIVRWGTDEYPSLLANIADPPALLYVKGGLLPQDHRAIAVVGSRRASNYGLAVCKKLCRELARLGWTVVSGMARGIDSGAHAGALEGGGRTLTVWGTGLDVVYPAENRQLAQRIAASGAIISEFPLGTPPEPGNFPARNRLISGLALAVVVVEAEEKSGSLITARMALDQDRQVCAVPGPIDRKTAAGPHRLIKEGAKLVERAEDIIEEVLPMVGGTSPVAPLPEKGSPARANHQLDDSEQPLWDLLGIDPLHIDTIARQLKLNVSQAAELLLRLEMKGLVKQLPGTFFVRDSGF